MWTQMQAQGEQNLNGGWRGTTEKEGIAGSHAQNFPCSYEVWTLVYSSWQGKANTHSMNGQT